MSRGKQLLALFRQNVVDAAALWLAHSMHPANEEGEQRRSYSGEEQ